MTSSIKKLYTLREPLRFRSYPQFMRWVAVNRPRDFAQILASVKAWFDTAVVQGNITLGISDRTLGVTLSRSIELTATSLSIQFDEQADRDAFEVVWKPIKAALQK